MWLGVVCALAFAGARAGADVRPPSEAERVAVQTAASYLDRGPEAVYENLAPTSPLKALRKEDALVEIETRLGPPAGASWELQTVVPALKDETAAFNVSFPSGIDDVVAFEMTREQKIVNIRTLADPSPTPPLFPPETKSEGEESPEVIARRTRLFALLLGFGGVLLAILSANVLKHHAGIARSLMALGVLAVAGGGWLGVKDDLQQQAAAKAAPAEKKDGYIRIGSLLPFRRALAAGNAADLDRTYREVAIGGLAKKMATLWKAQYDLEQMKLAEVDAALRDFPAPSNVPLAEILRGRKAFQQAKEVDAVVAYEHAISLGPGRDGLWMETAQALDTLGFDERAEGYLRRLRDIGSRDAAVYYSQAMIAAVHDREDDAEKGLETGWMLRPAERANLVRAGALWSTLRRPKITPLVQLNAAAEATFASPAAWSRPITIPLTAMARVSGDYLDLQIGQQELAVPGGACLAPVGTPIVDAGLWVRAEEEKGLQDFPQLLTVAHTTGAYAQPLLRRRILRCGNALAVHHRWNDLLQLTDGLDGKAEHVPVEVAFLRDYAFQRTDRVPEAKLLMMQLAQSPVVKRKNSPQLYAEIGEMLALLDEYDAAVKLLDRAMSAHATGALDQEVAKIQMNKRLATKFATVTSPHFVIHYPDDIPQDFAQRMATILESELKRMQRYVPTPNFRPTVVNMLWWQDFRSTYTGNDFILGFYQGKITVPLAGISDFVPEAVAILTHELTHAMIGQATNEQAPPWFQEGMAQRMEMAGYRPNAFNMYEDQKLLSVSVLDAVLHGSPDPEMIGEAYIVSQTIIRYIEATYGPQGLAKMLAAYRDGATTEEAIKQLSGLSVADFDTKLRAWGRTGTKIFENHEFVDYQVHGSDEIRWTKRGGQQ